MQLQRILHIDDDADILDLSRLALSDLGGFELVQCGSVAAALAELERFAPDLILLDVVMPDCNGKEAYSLLRQQEGTRDTPIVFMTAKGQKGDREQLLSVGAAGIVSKPFNPMTLCDELTAFWEKSVRKP